MKCKVVENKLKGLNKILADGKEHEFALMLAGGLCFSRKTIKLTKSGKYKITNHIDDTRQLLTAKQIMDSSYTNIGEGLTKRALLIPPDKK